MSTAGHHFCFGSASSFFLEPFLQSSPVAYWTPTDLDGSSFSAISFLFFSYCSWGSQGKNADVVCHCLPQWTTFRQNSPPWFVHVGWPDMAWLIQAVTHALILVSFLWLWLSVFPLWRRIRGLCKLSDGRDWLWGKLGLALWGSWVLLCGQGHAQQIFHPIFCWWMGLCSLSVVWPEAAQSWSLVFSMQGL